MNSDLPHKLFQYEATPPEAAWDKIVDALDAEINLTHRLYYYEESPPAQTWQTIEAGLQDSPPAKVIPLTRRFKRPMRYIGAASFIAAVLITVTLLMKRTEAGSAEAGSRATVPTKETRSNTPDNLVVSPKNTIVTESKIAPVASANLNEGYAPTDKTRRASAFISTKNLLSSVAVAGGFIPKRVDENLMFDNASLNNYMVYSDGDGNAMKLPKKLFTLVHCQDGDGSCKERIHHLRQILSSNAINADFTGIVEMLRQLQ